jgi:hypothetical protein
VHVSDTDRAQYRHAPVGAGTVPFNDVPPVLAELRHMRRPMLEIISIDPDRDILDSAARLAQMGFIEPAARTRA